eukprot:m.103890 g.103890  ORF g.103890 m.103890 type:complete len:223 (-) comp27524_c0_seq1:233-901(-)
MSVAKWLTKDVGPAHDLVKMAPKQKTLYDLKKVVVLEDVLKHRDRLRNSDCSPEELVATLQQLDKLHMTEKILVQTKVGKPVKRLTVHKAADVRRLAKQIMKKWIDMLEKPKAESIRLKPAPPPNPELRVRDSAKATLTVRLIKKCCKDGDDAEAKPRAQSRAEELAASADQLIFARASRSYGKRYGRGLRTLIQHIEDKSTRAALLQVWNGTLSWNNYLDS